MIATGLPASPGAAVGQIVFTADDAEAWHAQGKAVILVSHVPCHIGFDVFEYLQFRTEDILSCSLRFT